MPPDSSRGDQRDRLSVDSYSAFRKDHAKEFPRNREWTEAQLREALPGLTRRIEVVTQTAGGDAKEGAMALFEGDKVKNPMRETLPRVVADMLARMLDTEGIFWAYNPADIDDKARKDVARKFVGEVRAGDYFMTSIGLQKLRVDALSTVSWHRKVLGQDAHHFGGKVSVIDDSGIVPIRIETFGDADRQGEHLASLARLRDIDIAIAQLDLSRHNTAFGAVTHMVEAGSSGIEHAEEWTAAAVAARRELLAIFDEKDTDPLVFLSKELGLNIGELSTLPLEEQRSRLSKAIQGAARELHPDVRGHEAESSPTELAKGERYKKLVAMYSKIKTTDDLSMYWKTFGWLLPADRLEVKKAEKTEELDLAA